MGRPTIVESRANTDLTFFAITPSKQVVELLFFSLPLFLCVIGALALAE